MAKRRPKVSKSVPATAGQQAHDVYSELLSEAAGTSASDDNRERPTKKRRVGEIREHSRVVTSEEGPRATRDQIVYDDSPSDEASDLDWQEVDLQQGHSTDEDLAPAAKALSSDISIVIGKQPQDTPKRRLTNRLPSSAIEKKKRLETHKVHVCCLLAHAYVRNAWCNDKQVKMSMKKLLNDRTISYLNPKPEFSQFQRTRSFLDGLQQASDVFTPAFKVIAAGLRRPQWRTDPAQLAQLSLSDEVESVTSIDDFLTQAKRREGSRDVGAQLFCAMLRSAGVDARLVCSLQPLSFASLPPAPTPPRKKPNAVYLGSGSDVHHETSDDGASGTDRSVASNVSLTSATTSTRIKRFGARSTQELVADLGKAPPTPTKRRKLIESHFPVYWVEAFNVAQQKWISVDPVVTHTINKPQKFEPPASDALNDMTYVIAFGRDGSAKDVTRRYAKAYNAKTRRARIESTKDGQRWWKKALKIFKIAKQDRDQVEDAELSRFEAAEPMPRNVLDFKDHPYYALERHLRQNEVILPKREVGKLSTGKGANAIESIYRRQDVQIVHTADKWFRRAGREIKPAEQPLKYVAVRRTRRQRSPSTDSEADDSERQEPAGVGLYAESQTKLYIPPAISNGKVPKNAFGNLDIYMPSMIPPGGVHVKAAEGAIAAKIVGIDYADAVTGFEFRGRRGTAVVLGVVVAAEHGEAMREVVESLRWEKEAEEQKKRGLEALRMWKRFLVGLQIRERIMSYGDEEKGKDWEVDVKARIDDVEMEEEEVVGDGGFLPDVEQPAARPTVSQENQDGDGHEAQLLSTAATLVADPQELGIPTSSAYGQKMLVYSPWDLPGPLAAQYIAARGGSPRSTRTNVASREKIGSASGKLVLGKGGFGNGSGGGGFMHSDHGEQAHTVDFEDGGEGFMVAGEDDGGGFVADEDDGGGGFMVVEEEEDDGGREGGFLAEESKHDDQNEALRPERNEEDSDDNGGGFHVQDHDGETRPQLDKTLAQQVETRASQEQTTHPAPSYGGDGTIEQPGEPVSNVAKVVAEAASGAHMDKAATELDNEENSEAGSLFSEDPEDMDAEPEWIQ